MVLNEKQTELCEPTPSDFSALRAVYINCTLKRPDQSSHTELLMGTSAEMMRKNGVVVDVIRPTAHQIAFGVYPDMTEHGWERDDWPMLWKKIKAADVLVLGTPIWLGEESSVCRLIIERLYGMSTCCTQSRPATCWWMEPGWCCAVSTSSGE